MFTFVRCCGIVLFWLAVQSSYGQNYALILDSRPGDWVGGGLSWYYTLPSASFAASKNDHNGVSVSMTMGSECWSAHFTSPYQAQLTVGTYEHASRYPFEGVPFLIPYDAGLIVSGGFCSSGHVCDQIDGNFIVTELVWTENGEVASFHARFTQSCERFEPPLQGEIFYNSAEALPPLHHITSPAVSYATEGQPFYYQVTTSKPETAYSASGLPAGLTLTAATGVISGVAEEHGPFDVMLTASGPAGSATAVLNLIVDPPGRSTGPFTAMRLVSTLGDPIGLGHEYSADAGDGTFTGFGGTDYWMDLGFKPWSFFTSSPPDSSGNFYLRLEGATAVLAPGVYVDLHPESARPDIFAAVGTASPYSTTGSFRIREISADPNAKLQQFRASFVQFSNGSLLSPMRGWIWYKAENVITSWPYAFGKEGQPFAYQIIANNQPFSYGCSDLPPGLSLDPQTGRIVGTPNVSGSYTVTLNALGPTSNASDDLWLNITPRRTLANISTRAKVGLGENSLIGGFIVTGPENKRVIIRAIGPSLSASGLTNPLSDPILELHNGVGVSIALNDDWRSQQAEVEATGIPPLDDRESAIVATLTPGSYTAVVTGKNSGTGVGLVEMYDIGPSSDAQLANISTRGFVDMDDNVLIGGLIVTGGNGEIQSRILLRAIGPSLINSGISNYLIDPVLDLHDANGAIIVSNDNWGDSHSQQTEIGSTGIAPSEPFESAILVDLPVGNYTALVRGKNSGTGVALVEAYQLGN